MIQGKKYIEEKEDRANFDEFDHIDDSSSDESYNMSSKKCLKEKKTRGDNNDEIIIEEKEISGLPTIDKNTIEIQKIRLSILRYKQLFSEHLSIYGERLNLENLEQLRGEELNLLLKEIQVTIGCRNSASMITTTYFSTIGLLETLSPKLNMKLQGLQASLMNNKNIVETLTEISLEYESLSYVHPIQRLAIQTGQTILFLHQTNMANEKKESFLKEKVDKEIIEEFKEI